MAARLTLSVALMLLQAQARLHRGSWLSNEHDRVYGRGFKMRSINWWSGSHELARALNAAAQPQRDIYQFGVYTGGTMRSISKRIRGFGHMYGFDSFTGLPVETAGVKLEGSHWGVGAFSSADAIGEYDERKLLRALKERIGYANTSFVVGFYNESLTKKLARSRPFQPALLVDVDVDLYTSAVDCLRWMLRSRLLVPGSFVRYDDWRTRWQDWGEALAHRTVTREHNITWLNVAGTKEWKVLAIGDYAGHSDRSGVRVMCRPKAGELCRLRPCGVAGKRCANVL